MKLGDEAFEKLYAEIASTGRLKAARFQPRVLRLLADLWDMGKAGVAWGTVRQAGWAAAKLGLVEVCATEMVDGKAHALLKLREIGPVLDLAARCSLAHRENPDIELTALVVPDELPAKAWQAGARACPRCRCTPDRPCTLTLDDGCGTGECSPAGVHDLPVCSGCLVR